MDTPFPQQNGEAPDRGAHGKKVLVAMSGGVDSSVVAALLQQQGYDVTGAFMKNWSDEPDACTGGCGWQDERSDALRVAAKLGIPLLTFDFEDEYRKRVMEYMVREYAAGRTPNPDVLCNSTVKFDLFLREARTRGFDWMATGHYARVVHDGGRHQLLAGVDANKDQSYFLHRLTQDQLANTLFPIGGIEKPRVRELARAFGLPTAAKKDSQGICFVGKVDLPAFLREKIASHPGDFITKDGKRVGAHDGAAPFTIGQRHGMGLGGGDPWFVIAKDVDANTVTVSRNPDDLLAPALETEGMHWIAGTATEFPLECEVRIRYRQPLQRATVHAPDAGGLTRIAFAEPQRAVTPGQFAVLYSNDGCLGGGTIARAVEQAG